MTDYQPTEQAKVRLDYAQTEMRRADPWVEFEFYAVYSEVWMAMQRDISNYSGATQFRRKPALVTLSCGDRKWELPVPNPEGSEAPNFGLPIYWDTAEKRNQWLTALREIAGGMGDE